MVDDTLTVSFLVIDTLFPRYTILVNKHTDSTSVYCTECDVWVTEYSGDQVKKYTKDEFLVQIMKDHDHQINGVPVSFNTGDANTILE